MNYYDVSASSGIYYHCCRYIISTHGPIYIYIIVYPWSHILCVLVLRSAPRSTDRRRQCFRPSHSEWRSRTERYRIIIIGNYIRQNISLTINNTIINAYAIYIYIYMPKPWDIYLYTYVVWYTCSIPNTYIITGPAVFGGAQGTTIELYIIHILWDPNTIYTIIGIYCSYFFITRIDIVVKLGA